MPNPKKIRVLIPYSIPKEIINLLEQQGFYVKCGPVDQEELPEVIKEFNAIIINSNNQLTADVLDKAIQLEFAIRAGSGFDNIDVTKATEKGITVAITPEANVTAVAEHALGFILILARHLLEGDDRIRNKKWRDQSLEGIELEGKTLGVLGFGRIGKKLAEKAKALGMKVITHDPFISAAYKRKHGVRDVTFDELLALSDVLSLHIPKTPQTAYIINKNSIAKMKDNAIIINTSRGGVADEKALVAALASGKLRGVGLDVFDSKPEKDVKQELISTQKGKIVLEPHLAAATIESRFKSARDAAAQIISAFNTGFVRWAVNGDLRIPYESEDTLDPYLQLIPRLSALSAKILVSQGVKKVDEIILTYSTDLSGHNLTPIQASAVVPLNNIITGKKINGLNYKENVAKNNIKIKEIHDDTICSYPGIPTAKLEVKGEGKIIEIVGEFSESGPRIMLLNNFSDLDLYLDDKNLLLLWNKDRPGAVEWVGAQAAKNGINIRTMKVVEELDINLQPTGHALMVIHLDRPLTPEEIKQFQTSGSKIVTNILFESNP